MTKAATSSLRLNLDADLRDDYGITGNKAISTVNVTDELAAPAAADSLYHASGSIADAAFVDLNFATMVDALGVACNLTKIYTIFVKNTTAAGGATLHVGDSTGALANEWWAAWDNVAGMNKVAPQSALVLHNAAGWTVDATHKMLRLLHDGTGAADITYEIAIVGEMT